MPTLGPPGTRLSYDQLKALWIQNGGNPASAPIMAGIAIAESGGLSNNLNDKGKDYSVGLWQINYYGSLLQGRSQSYGTPLALAQDVNAQAKAAIKISGNGVNLQPWTTFTSGDAGRVMAAHEQGLGGLPATPPLPSIPVQATTAGAAGPGAVDDEGYLIDLTMPSAIPNIRVSRAAARKVIGAAVIVGGAVTGLAGAFLLVGGKAPGPAGIVQTAIKQRGQTTRTRTREAGLSERQDRRSTVASERDDLAARRRAKQTKAEGEYTSARAAGEQAADEAGSF